MLLSIGNVLPGFRAMKKIVASAIVLGLLGGPVSAQKSRDDDPIMVQERDKQQQAQALDKQYKRTLDQTRKEGSAPVRSDPWANMRGSNDGKR
jgi:hypothetical protein